MALLLIIGLIIEKSRYNHIIHIRGHNDFRFSNENTSHKRMFSGFYIAVKSKKFVYLQNNVNGEKVSNLNNQNKINNLKLIFLHVAETVHFELINKSSIEDYIKEYYKNDLDKSSSNGNDKDDRENMDD